MSEDNRRLARGARHESIEHMSVSEEKTMCWWCKGSGLLLVPGAMSDEAIIRALTGTFCANKALRARLQAAGGAQPVPGKAHDGATPSLRSHHLRSSDVRSITLRQAHPSELRRAWRLCCAGHLQATGRQDGHVASARGLKVTSCEMHLRW